MSILLSCVSSYTDFLWRVAMGNALFIASMWSAFTLFCDNFCISITKFCNNGSWKYGRKNMTNMAGNPELQSFRTKIQEHSDESSERISKLDATCYEAVNAVLKKRSDYLVKEGIAGKLWGAAILAHKDFKEELIGPYDELILSSLTNIMITYISRDVTDERKVIFHDKVPKTEALRRIEFFFNSANNHYFKNDLLWAEINDTQGVKGEHVLKVSGIQWREGKGPLPEEAEAATATSGDAGRTSKRPREEGEEEGCGPSLFEIFEPLPRCPLDDEVDEENAEEQATREEEWDELYNERMEVFKAIMEEIWPNPVGLIQEA